MGRFGTFLARPSTTKQLDAAIEDNARVDAALARQEPRTQYVVQRTDGWYRTSWGFSEDVRHALRFDSMAMAEIGGLQARVPGDAWSVVPVTP